MATTARKSTALIALPIVCFVLGDCVSCFDRSSAATDTMGGGPPALSSRVSVIDSDEVADVPGNRDVTVTFADKGVLQGTFGTIRDQGHAWNAWQYYKPHHPAVLFWKDPRACSSDHHSYPHSVERIAVADVFSLELFANQSGRCGGTLIRVTTNSGDVSTKSLVSRIASYGGVWSYGPIRNEGGNIVADDLVLFTPRGPVSIALSDVHTIVFSASTRGDSGRTASVQTRSSTGEHGVTDTTSILPSGTKGRLAFVSDRDGSQAIYAINTGGSAATKLLPHSVNNQTPRWAPDGRRLAFVSSENGNRALYVTRADGRHLLKLATNPAQDAELRWSPDGRRIAFVAREDGGEAIYIVDVPPSGYLGAILMSVAPDYRARLTRLATGSAPAWSPDGRRIAFHAPHKGRYEIAVTNADGTGLSRLTDTAADYGSNQSPNWAADGGRIAFVRSESNWFLLRPAIYIMNADGSHETRLTNDPDLEGEKPTWSPTSPLIAFEGRRGGAIDIYVSAIGAKARRLTGGPGRPSDPMWSPDGEHIAFVSNDEGNADIYVGSTEHAMIVNATRSPANDCCPSWLP